MRNVLWIMGLMMFAQTVLAQSDSPKWDSVKCYCCKVETVPKYPGGQEAMMRFFDQHFQYPDIAQDADFCGSIAVQYTIDKTGNTIDIKIHNSFNIDFSKEITRVIKLFKYEPATQNGRKVSYRQKQHFNIYLSEEIKETPMPITIHPVPIT